ncbi:MAG TPA: hypothetical protein VIU61_02000 [Kofleriaceae bacterium]
MRWLPILVLAACDPVDPATPKDASEDAPDAIPCGTPTLTGELIDWDSTTTAFMGIAGATVSLEGGATGDPTPPNGRWELCASGDPIRLVIETPGTYVDALGYVENTASGARALSLRSFTAARAETFYSERGLGYDPALAHVLVFFSGDRFELALDRAHAAPQAANDDDGDGAFTWSDGPVGSYVLFPNVAVTQPTGTFTGDGSGPHTIPLVAGKLTIAAIHHVFL